MHKELALIEEQLGQVAQSLRLMSLYIEEPSLELSGKAATEFLLESTDSEREFILHKLCPDIEIIGINQKKIEFKLK